MGKGCITVTKYFLFLFNLLFFVSDYITLAELGHRVRNTCTAGMSAALFTSDKKIKGGRIGHSWHIYSHDMSSSGSYLNEHPHSSSAKD